MPDQTSTLIAAPVPQHSSYRAPAWLPGRHLQTIYPAQFAPRANVSYQRERWDTPDGDFIDVDFTDYADSQTGDNPGDNEAPLLILFHGLEGCSESHYAVALMAEARERQWLGAVVHFRGCSGELNLAPRAYHSGDSAELDWILRRFAQRFATRSRHVAGISLGGNALLKWLGEQGTQAEAIVTSAAAISAPHDLQAGAHALSNGFSRLYGWNFLRTLKRKSLAKLVQHPGLFDEQRLRNARDFFDFDDAVTAPMHGFTSCYDYWERSSSKQFLHAVRAPTLVLNARNDPFQPPKYLAVSEQASPSVKLEYPYTGGHVGFVKGTLPGSLDWLRERVFNWYQTGH